MTVGHGAVANRPVLDRFPDRAGPTVTKRPKPAATNPKYKALEGVGNSRAHGLDRIASSEFSGDGTPDFGQAFKRRLLRIHKLRLFRNISLLVTQALRLGLRSVMLGGQFCPLLLPVIGVETPILVVAAHS
jgi:hypothetical protein